MAFDTMGPLKDAAQYIMSRVRDYAPTVKSADSFRLRRSGREYLISSRDTGTIATELGVRHPLFGNRDWWFGPAGRQVGREHFMENAAEAALDDAAEKFASEWAGVVVRSTVLELAR
jgi:hypothetical protein